MAHLLCGLFWGKPHLSTANPRRRKRGACTLPPARVRLPRPATRSLARAVLIAGGPIDASRSRRVASPGAAHDAFASLCGICARANPLKRSCGLQLAHIRLVVAQAFPRPGIVFLSRIRGPGLHIPALKYTVIVLDDLRLLLHVEVAQRNRGIEVIKIGVVVVPPNMIVLQPEIDASQGVVAAMARLPDLHHFMNEHRGLPGDLTTVIPAP